MARSFSWRAAHAAVLALLVVVPVGEVPAQSGASWPDLASPPPRAGGGEDDAGDRDGQVTAGEAVAYARATLRVMATGRTQTPLLDGAAGNAVLTAGREAPPELLLPHHRPESRTVRIAAAPGGGRQRVDVALAPTFATLVVPAPAGAAVFLDEAEVGVVSGAGFESGPLAPGVHQVELRLPNHHPARTSVTLAVGDRRVVTLEMVAQAGGLQVLARTPDGAAVPAEVWLDGRKVGAAPLLLDAAPAGRHERELRDPAGRLATGPATVEIAEGRTLQRVVTLKSDVPPGYVRVNPGAAWIGSPPDEPGYQDNEMRHRVTLTRAFLLEATEVTQGEWKRLMGGNPSHFAACGDDCPVERVSWFDAVGYLNALSRAEGLPECYVLAGCTGRAGSGCKPDESACAGDYTCTSVRFVGLDCQGYRFPTEAEWEVAARAGTDTALYTGGITLRGANDAPEVHVIAWYGGNSGVTYSKQIVCGNWEEKQYASDYCGPHPVGRKKPNAWGFYDLLGNVWEWTGDWYGAYATGAVTDPTGPRTGSHRVSRGGSWDYDARSVRAANRSYDDPAYRDDNVGFRPARSVP